VLTFRDELLLRSGKLNILKRGVACRYSTNDEWLV